MHLINFILNGGTIVLVPVYFLVGYLLGKLIIPLTGMPWYLTTRQFIGLIIIVVAVVFGFLALGYIESFAYLYLLPWPATVTSLVHPITSFVAFAKAEAFAIGVLTPFWNIRKKRQKTIDFQTKIKQKNDPNFIKGWFNNEL